MSDSTAPLTVESAHRIARELCERGVITEAVRDDIIAFADEDGVRRIMELRQMLLNMRT